MNGLLLRRLPGLPVAGRIHQMENRMESRAMTPALFAALAHITTGTITTILLKKGIRRCWMDGPKPLRSGNMPLRRGERVVGPAFTLRFLPVREDLATPESWSKPISTRGAIEEMPEGCIAVADAMGVTTAGIFGDILTLRMVRRGVAALVTDGAVRDKEGVLASALPVWCAGIAAPASVNGLTFIGWQEPIGCGGCAIFPGDIIVADADGAVVIPQNLVDLVATEGAEHERMEGWIVSEVEKGVRLPGLYPMNDETKARYEAWKRQS
jgi:regulator of RNase E activity RraA